MRACVELSPHYEAHCARWPQNPHKHMPLPPACLHYHLFLPKRNAPADAPSYARASAASAPSSSAGCTDIGLLPSVVLARRDTGSNRESKSSSGTSSSALTDGGRWWRRCAADLASMSASKSLLRIISQNSW
eukprot:281354-Chlamydomonas_euryale.AAC.3